MSELSLRSLALAESIKTTRLAEVTESAETKRQEKKRSTTRTKIINFFKKPMIVFTDVFEMEGEENYELMMRVHEIRGICVKKDISRLNLERKKNPIEFFILGEDESENVDQLIKLNDANLVKERKQKEKRIKNIAVKEACGEKKRVKEKNVKKREIKKQVAHRKRSVYIYSNKQSTAAILDSIDKGENVMPMDVMQLFEKTDADVSYTVRAPVREIDESENDISNIYQWLYQGKSRKEYSVDNAYYIRRINPVENLTLETLVSGKHLSGFHFEKKPVISILIVGLGAYGISFLKNALWLYQFPNVHLEINIIDKCKRETIVSMLGKMWPDVQFDSPYFIPGNSDYEINIFPEIDCTDASLDQLFYSDVYFNAHEKDDKKGISSRERLAKTNFAVIGLGDDELNIETAITLRQLFIGMKEMGTEDEKKSIFNMIDITYPVIYSVVYNEKMASNLGDTLINYKSNNLNISFIGSLTQQYSYSEIVKQREIEREGFNYHVEWLVLLAKLRALYENEEPQYASMLAVFKKEIEEQKEKEQKESNQTKIDARFEWGDEYLFTKTNTDGTCVLDYNKPNKDEFFNTLLSYYKFEYYRNSSVAKSLYLKMIDKSEFKTYFENTDITNILTLEQNKNINDEHINMIICNCRYCVGRRVGEHMRWNMYMRTIGYRTGKKRNDNAKIHDCIVKWNMIQPVQKKYLD